jgi:hypothetical protein
MPDHPSGILRTAAGNRNAPSVEICGLLELFTSPAAAPALASEAPPCYSLWAGKFLRGERAGSEPEPGECQSIRPIGEPFAAIGLDPATP